MSVKGFPPVCGCSGTNKSHKTAKTNKTHKTNKSHKTKKSH